MIPKPLEKIEAADILALVANSVEEQRTIDFKRCLPENSDKGKMELRADATSFANTSGGDLIFGVGEEKGVAAGVPGLPGIDPDVEILRIESIVQSGIDPRIPGFASRAIAIPNAGQVIVCRVPKSWRSPHLVKINDTFRMYGRNSRGKYTFDATEIRSAFALSDELPERIRRWRDDRIAKIISGETPVPLADGARIIVQVVSLPAFASGKEVSVIDMMKFGKQFQPLCSSGTHHRVNIDGFLKYVTETSDTQGYTAYCQVFRTGVVEAVKVKWVGQLNPQRTIGSRWFADELVASLTQYRSGLIGCDIGPPFVVFATLIGAKGAILKINPKYIIYDYKPIDRDFLTLPEVVIESRDSDLFTDLKPLFDGLWNACGWERCRDYNEQGVWAPDE